MFLSGRAEFLVPCFLTFDQDLAAIFELYPIKSCLVDSQRGAFPRLFPSVSLASILQGRFADSKFVNKHLTAEANQRRIARLRTQPPNLDLLAARLESGARKT